MNRLLEATVANQSKVSDVNVISKNRQNPQRNTGKAIFSYLLYKKHFLILCTFIFLLCACDSQEKKDAVGKYNLTSITGIPGVTPSLFEYNYIIFKDDGFYELKNKVEDVVTEQTGTWYITEGVIKARPYMSANTQEISKANDVLTMSFDDDGVMVTMEFTKEK